MGTHPLAHGSGLNIIITAMSLFFLEIDNNEKYLANSIDQSVGLKNYADFYCLATFND